VDRLSSFPGTPKVLHGAIVSIDITSPVPQVISFQYNPDSMTRTLQAQNIGGEGNRTEAYRLKGPPIETISLDAEFDATDQLAQQDPIAVSMGIYPQLSALEIILYPKSALVIANTALAALGTIEIIPPMAPFTVFIWGAKRVLPVRLTDFRIAEEAYDTNLNPIRAKVSLGMRVMTYDDFDVTHPGYAMFLANQVVKETMAAIGSVNSLSSVVSGNVQLL
jgi:hypothetical protein